MSNESLDPRSMWARCGCRDSHQPAPPCGSQGRVHYGALIRTEHWEHCHLDTWFLDMYSLDVSSFPIVVFLHGLTSNITIDFFTPISWSRHMKEPYQVPLNGLMKEYTKEKYIGQKIQWKQYTSQVSE